MTGPRLQPSSTFPRAPRPSRQRSRFRSRRLRRQSTLRWLGLLIAFTLASSFLGRPAAARAQEAPELPVELTPYRILVSVSFKSHPQLGAPRRQAALQEFQTLVENLVGRSWNLSVESSPAADVHGERWLDELTPAALLQNDLPDDIDKWTQLLIRFDGSRFHVAAREWDAVIRRLSPVQTETVALPRALPRAMLSTARAAFQPRLTIEAAAHSSARLRLQAGAFPTADPALEQLQPGDIIVPFLRYRDRNREVRRVQEVPWTYLMVESITNGRVQAAVVSGLRSPLSGGRRLVELWAARVEPRFPTTDLRLTTRGERPEPLVGFPVRIEEKISYRDEPLSPPVTRLSNRDGVVTIERSEQLPLVWLYVQSGDALLARVPFVPGIEEQVALPVTDDRLRLSVEGQTSLLKADLIDTVARRAALMVRMRRLARDGDWEAVDQAMAELKNLPGVRQYQARLNLIRTPAIDLAQERRDRVAEVEIRRLCTATDALITNYLNPDKIRIFEEEISELKKAASGN